MADGMTEEEIEACRLAFEKFDADGSGTIEANELKVTLQSMGQNPTDEEIFEMLSSVDEDGSGSIDFGEFLMVIKEQKAATAAAGDEGDTILAFVALGGKPDKTGIISAEKLRQTCKDFGLTIDIDALIKEYDADGSGEIDYEEFRDMLS